jgi:HAD superfamily hydrolase (TIGR01484 family)
MGIKLIAFDLDGTLAPSKGPISLEMSRALKDLLDYMPVCIITGGSEKQIQSQVISRLLPDTNLKNLQLMPTSGAIYLKYRFWTWRTVYSIELKKQQARKIEDALKVAAELLGYWPEQPYGKVIEDRGAQVTFSALGQKAPEYLKEAWDKDGSKKKLLRDVVSKLLPEFEVRSGGSTSIDVTRIGIDKGFAVRELMNRTFLKKEEILFVGDRFDVDGNDYPVIETGVEYQAVTGSKETLRLIRDLLKTIKL